MENLEKYSGVLLIIAIIGLLLFWSEYGNLQTELSATENLLVETEDELYDVKNTLSDCDDALHEANDQLDSANIYAWSSYNEMGETLENLYPVDY